MARARSRLSAGTLIFDCEGLVKWCQAERRVTSIVREAQDNDFRVVVSAITPVEAQDVRVKADGCGSSVVTSCDHVARS